MRFPFAPLEALARIRIFNGDMNALGMTPRNDRRNRMFWPSVSVANISDRQIASFFGVDNHTIARWRTHGLGTWQADRMAAKLCLYPSEIWGDMWFEAVDVAS